MAVSHLRFARNGVVYLVRGKASEVIGVVSERKRIGPRGGTFPVFDWEPKRGAPVNLAQHINQSTRMRDIHRELIVRHYAPAAARPTAEGNSVAQSERGGE